MVAVSAPACRRLECRVVERIVDGVDGHTGGVVEHEGDGELDEGDPRLFDPASSPGSVLDDCSVATPGKADIFSAIAIADLSSHGGHIR
jgi:hypothetical protein